MKKYDTKNIDFFMLQIININAKYQLKFIVYTNLFCPIGIKIHILLLIFNMLKKNIISRKRNNLIRKRIIKTCGG